MRPLPPAIRVGEAQDGTLTYLVDQPPDALPPVRSRDLEAAWDAARTAALAHVWGVARRFRFLRQDGSVTDLALSDRDACCWAGAVEALSGMQTQYGLSVCLRLLALVDLLARAPWIAASCRLGRGAAELPAVLLRAAATARLTDQAAFDETDFRASLARLPSPSGAFA